jgi:hypothetical protein
LYSDCSISLSWVQSVKQTITSLTLPSPAWTGKALQISQRSDSSERRPTTKSLSMVPWRSTVATG